MDATGRVTLRRGLDFPRRGGYFVLIDRPCRVRVGSLEVTAAWRRKASRRDPRRCLQLPPRRSIATARRRHRPQGWDEAAGRLFSEWGLPERCAARGSHHRGSRRNRRGARSRNSGARTGIARSGQSDEPFGELRAPSFGHRERSLRPDGFRRSESAPAAQERTGTRGARPRQQGGARPLPLPRRAILRLVLVQRPRGRQRDNLFLLPQQP